ncbi:hypothetical protein AMJ80_02590 [bacterium SM23_31]|nr:MAG: hypothetical protein AMJ80_02590 [bacterium SM23_31]
MVFFKYGLFFTIRSGYFFIRMAEYVSIYFIISDMIKDQKTRIIIIRLIWIITLFICSVGLYQYHISGLPSITSTLSESHVYLGTFLMFTFFILAGYIFVTKNVLEKIALLLTLPLMIYILFLSALRTGILSIIVGIIVFFVFSRKPIGWMVAVVLAIILILFGFEFLQNLQEYELGSAGFRNLERDLSTMGRFYIWYGTIVMLKQNPTILITGVGLSAFGLAVERYTPLFPGSGGAHNNYLHHLTETGMFGLAIFLYILFIFLRTSLKRSREPAQKDRALYYGYFCGLAALVFSGMSQETFSVQNAHGNFLGYFFIVTSLVFSKPKNFYDETENEIS